LGGGPASFSLEEGSAVGDSILQMKGIGKSFGGVQALGGVSFDVRRGEIHSLCGENGAGKSTLMKVLSGMHHFGSYEGEIVVEGKTRAFHGTRDSERAGIAIIYQELALAKEMTIAENIFLGREPGRGPFLDAHRMYGDASRLLEEVGLDLSPATKLKSLGIGQQQLVEIAKALSKDARILILDEPTAALTEEEVGILMGIIRKLKASGVTCVYISHKLGEVLDISDRVTVLRDGKTIGTLEREEMSEGAIIRMMVGREITDRYPKAPSAAGARVVEVRGLSAYDPRRERQVLSDISFSVRSGEILGIAGLMGAGRTELLMCLFGATDWRVEGSVLVDGREVRIQRPRDAIREGIGLVSEDRRRYGLVMPLSLMENMSLASLDKVSRWQMLDANLEAKLCGDEVRELNIKSPHLGTKVSALSGGNQQKVVLARWLMLEPRVLFLDEPTRGIDVGAKHDIYLMMNELARKGIAIVMVSSELPEVMGMSDRLLVMREGRLAGEFRREEYDQERIMASATGGRL
jgi:ABC-type sugar transport system ATPase subunit